MHDRRLAAPLQRRPAAVAECAGALARADIPCRFSEGEALVTCRRWAGGTGSAAIRLA